MSRRSARFCGVFAGVLAFMQPIATHAYAATPNFNQTAPKRMLQHFAYDPDEDGKSTRYSATAVPGTDLALVYLIGPDWCGSGGCRLLVLRKAKGSFRIMSECIVVWRPVTILKTRHHGLPDISVWVQGGGILPGYRAALPFDGKRYPLNPSMPPARRVPDHAGRVILAADDPGVPLFD